MKQYLKRFSTSGGTATRLRPHDFRRFAAMAPYPFLTADYLSALAGGNPQCITNRFKNLKRAPNTYIKVADYQRQNGSLFMNFPLAYALTDQTKEMLTNRGIRIHTTEFSGPFFHQLYSVQTRASFDIAAQEIDTVSIIGWDKLSTDQRVPQATRESDSPHHFDIPKSVRIPNQSQKLVSDCYPFIVQNTALQNPAFHFLGLECDMGTETIGTTIRAKITYYRYLLENGIYKEKLGFPKAHVAFVTALPGRVESILKEIEKQTERTPNLRRYFLVKHSVAPNEWQPDLKPSPTGHMVTEPWRRVGLEPLYLHK